MSSPVFATPATNEAGPTVAVLENLPDAILLVDESGAVSYANAAAENLFAEPADQLVGRPFPGLLSEPFEAEYTRVLEAHAAGESSPLVGERREVVLGRHVGLRWTAMAISEAVNGAAARLDGVATARATEKRPGMAAMGIRDDAEILAAHNVAFDRPYLLLVSAKSTGEPLFLAEVANPASS